MDVIYINNFESRINEILFTSFKVILIVFAILLILSLLMLIFGCLIKSQKIKSRFLIIVLSLFVGNVFFLFFPYLLIMFKNLS